MRRARAVCALILALAAPAIAAAEPSGVDVPAMAISLDVGSAGVEIAEVTPIVAGPGEEVTISGSLDVKALDLDLSAAATTSATDGDATSEDDPAPPVALVEVRSAPSPVTTHDEVTAWVESSAPSGGRLLRSEPIEAPGRASATTVPFTVAVANPRGGRAAAYGVVPVSLQVYRPGEVSPAAVVHTFLGYQAVGEYLPLALTLVIPFVVPADPALVGEFGPERVAAWERLVDTGGVLRERLEEVSGSGVTWALDPALLSGGPGTPPSTLDDVEASTATPEPTTSAPHTSTDGETDSGAGPDTPTEAPTEEVPASGPAAREAQLRTAYATAVLDAARDVDVLVLPTHDGDVAALDPRHDAAESAVRSVVGEDLDVTAALKRLRAAGARARAVAWPVDGEWSPSQDRTLSEVAAETSWDVLLSADQVAGRMPGPTMGPAGGALLPYDMAISERATATTGAVTSGLTLMADTLVTLNESPGVARHRVIAVDRYAPIAPDLDAVTDLLEDVPWVSLETIPAAIGAGALIESPDDDPEPDTSAPALTEDRATALLGTHEKLVTAASVRAGAGPDLATRGADVLRQLTSARWRGAPDEWDRAYEPIADDVSATFTSLRIPARDISFLADSGVMRVIVQNSLDDGIRNATLELTVDRPILRIENGPQPVDVGAASRSTVGFDATAIASGRVSVTAIVRAADGTALSEPSTFEVRVSPTAAWIYWVLGGLGALIILVGVIRTIRRRHSG